nr:MAG: hypothetical protein CM15mV30_0420 [uncultured marine virus]
MRNEVRTLKDIPADLIEKSRDAMKFEDNKYQAFFKSNEKVWS